jgi:hypothetical protein
MSLQDCERDDWGGTSEKEATDQVKSRNVLLLFHIGNTVQNSEERLKQLSILYIHIYRKKVLEI